METFLVAYGRKGASLLIREASNMLLGTQVADLLDKLAEDLEAALHSMPFPND
jgi:hypothetical protein